MLKVWGSSLFAAGLVLMASSAFAQASCETDFNGDGTTDAADVEILKAALGSREGDANYDAAIDLNGDGAVSTIDYQVMLNCN